MERPFVFFVGGLKVEDKREILPPSAGRADTVLVGGLKAERLHAENSIGRQSSFRATWSTGGVQRRTPKLRSCRRLRLPQGWLRARRRPAHPAEAFRRDHRKAKTIFWNGPMGVFRVPRFAEGTKAMADAVAHADAYSVVGAPTRCARSRSWASPTCLLGLDRWQRRSALAGKDLPGVP